jgi:hypothetical protein
MKAYGGVDVYVHIFVVSALAGGWVGPRAGLEDVEKSKFFPSASCICWNKLATHSDTEDGGSMYLRNIDNTADIHTMQRRMSSLAIESEPQNRFRFSAWRRDDNLTSFMVFLIPSRQNVAQYHYHRRFLSYPFQFIIPCLPTIPRSVVLYNWKTAN